ncbi:MAG: winged helix-turn-helix transcriptional regulator [Candidatus Uhrbacteria bacterium]|nr:winged helix-turn-helix transcriptional regulator [Candidatus Uhrbacteria bacterium]
MPNQFTPKQKQEITEVLSGFGFNPKDERVYLALLEMGSTTLTPLARRLSLPVTTIQSTMQRLVKKGVVDVTKNKSRSVFQAHHPDVFKTLLTEQAKSVAGILPLLASLKTETLEQARIKIFERERVTDILNESLNAKSKTVYEIVSAKEFQEVIGEKFHYSKRRVQKNINLKSLRVRSHEIKQYSAATHAKELREARFLPADLSFHASILFWDDTIVIFSTKSEGAHVMITSKSIREMIQQLFELLWSVSGKMETLAQQTQNG